MQEARQRAAAVCELVASGTAAGGAGRCGSPGDDVVRRRADDVEVLRPEGDRAGESVTYDHVGRQLETSTVAEFREMRGIAD